MNEYMVLRASAAEDAPAVGAVQWRDGAVRAYGDAEFTASVVKRVRSLQFRRHLETGTPLRSGFGRQEYDNFELFDEGDPAFEKIVRNLLDDGGEVEVVPKSLVGDGWTNPDEVDRLRKRKEDVDEELARLEVELDAMKGSARDREATGDLLEVTRVKSRRLQEALDRYMDSENPPSR